MSCLTTYNPSDCTNKDDLDKLTDTGTSSLWNYSCVNPNIVDVSSSVSSAPEWHNSFPTNGHPDILPANSLFSLPKTPDGQPNEIVAIGSTDIMGGWRTTFSPEGSMMTYQAASVKDNNCTTGKASNGTIVKCHFICEC